MFTVALRPGSAHEVLAEPLGQSLAEPGITLLVLLVLAGTAVFQGLRAMARALGASMAATLLLLRPVLALIRLLLTILALLALVVIVLVTGAGEDATGRPMPAPAPGSTHQAPPPIGSVLPAEPTR